MLSSQLLIDALVEFLAVGPPFTLHHFALSLQSAQLPIYQGTDQARDTIGIQAQPLPPQDLGGNPSSLGVSRAAAELQTQSQHPSRTASNFLLFLYSSVPQANPGAFPPKTHSFTGLGVHVFPHQRAPLEGLVVLKDPLHRTWNLGKLKTGDQSSILAPSFPPQPPLPSRTQSHLPASSLSAPLLGSGFILSCLDHHPSLLPSLPASPHSSRGSCYTQSGLCPFPAHRPSLARQHPQDKVSTPQPGVQDPM